MFHVANQLLSLGQRAYLSTRQCSICGDFKATSEFSVKDKTKGWLDTRCKPCKSEQITKYQSAKKKKQNGHPESGYFLRMFEGISVSKVIMAFDEITFKSVHWGNSSKRHMAERWATRFSEDGFKSLRTVDLEKVRELALSY